MMDYVNSIKSYKPKAIVAYTTPIYKLAKFMLAQNIFIEGVTSIITGAEALFEYQRAVISKAFNCPVYNTYGSRETMLIASECIAQNGLHTNIDHLVVETVSDDGTPVTGTAGDVVITDLSNFAMPLIRYINGDTARLSQRKCTCGCPLPLIEEISGRKGDVIEDSLGAVVPTLFFPHVVKDYDGIESFQIRRKSLKQLVLLLTTNKSLDSNAFNAIKAKFSELKTTFTLDIQEVDAIPLTKAGKHQIYVSEI